MIKAALIVLIVFALGVAGIGAYLSPDDLRQCAAAPSDKAGCQAADAIVAVSGGYTSVRAGEAINLYKNGWAPKLIFSGAAQDTSGPSNALVMKRQAEAAGVPASAISIDETARTTHQNAEETNGFVDKYHLTRLILVTSPYHERRASIEFRQIVGPGVQVVAHPAQNDPDWPWYWWATPRGWWLAGGELVKIGITHAGESE